MVQLNHRSEFYQSLSFVVFVLFFFLTSCQSPTLQTMTTQSHPYLFPYGNYQQKITIQWKDQTQSLNFRGVLHYSSKKIRLTGLSPFYSTLFFIEESPFRPQSPAPQIKVFMDEFKDKKEQLREFYLSMRPIFFLHPYEVQSTKSPINYRTSLQTPKGSVNFELLQIGVDQEPLLFHIQQAQWRAQVRTTDYEYLPHD